MIEAEKNCILMNFLWKFSKLIRALRAIQIIVIACRLLDGEIRISNFRKKEKLKKYYNGLLCDNRRFILIELDWNYFGLSREKILLLIYMILRVTWRNLSKNCTKQKKSGIWSAVFEKRKLIWIWSIDIARFCDEYSFLECNLLLESVNN